MRGVETILIVLYVVGSTLTIIIDPAYDDLYWELEIVSLLLSAEF